MKEYRNCSQFTAADYFYQDYEQCEFPNIEAIREEFIVTITEDGFTIEDK
jgi:hypothetical protein